MTMTADNERCPKTDMVVNGCWHCGARPGSAIILTEPEDRPTPTVPVLPRPSALVLTIREKEPADDITRVKRDLAEIIDLAAALPHQAVNDANASIDGTSLPGGNAMIALGPAADVESFERRIELAEAAWITRESALGYVHLIDGVPVAHDDRNRPDLAAEEDDDTAPPLQILRYWSNRYRWALGHVWDVIPTLQSEAQFLRSHDVITHAYTQDAAAWPHLARDINRCRTRLEDVLTAGRRQHRTRVECDRCEPIRRGDDDKPKHPRLILLIGADDDGSDDRWKCPNCKVRMDRSAMLRAHGRQLMRGEAAKYVSKAEAVSTLRLHGTSERTVRSWFGPARSHTADRCRVCKAEHPPGEFNVCPTTFETAVPGDGGYQLVDVPCGGFLTPVWTGVDHDAVLDSYCDTATHKVWVWWPDLWTKHQILRNKREIEATRRETA